MTMGFDATEPSTRVKGEQTRLSTSCPKKQGGHLSNQCNVGAVLFVNPIGASAPAWGAILVTAGNKLLLLLLLLPRESELDLLLQNS